MGDYAQAAEFYDVLYAGTKDYAAESAIVARLIRDAAPHARDVLDVGCGTGKHAQELTALGFHVDGLDLEPRFIDVAARRCPEGKFRVADMTQFRVEERYDAVACLFSSIGYVVTIERLHATLENLAAHLSPGGVLIIDPWFEPGQLTDGWISVVTGTSADTSVVRMQRTVLDGSVSHLEFEYLIGTARGIERRSERHALGLFTRDEMEEAFTAAGLAVQWQEAALRRRGAYIGRRA